MPRTTLAPTLALMLALASPAAATQEYILPTLFDVAGVAADDVLNIRADPNPTAPVIGTLAPDATRIEVVEERRGWVRVNTGEGSGWVNSRFLTYRTDVWNEGALPQGWQCFGTEPFWAFIPQGDSVVLGGPDTPNDMRKVQSVLSTGVFRDPTRAVVAEGMTLVSTPQLCSDGMSDRLFGLRAELVIQGNQPRMLSGCCSIQP
ncbi:COG3650 family protein [Paracoccus benzoatiresistens]|uniref:SH3 domain-containing protein n=1 Tax=Paracoccus benzoatiresistens TaxID=2997341 RepID=A0ABT4J2G2_9RHOB|nr:SH3 domain-containing protein [Paracoccus sp. EF6]MCZ0961297.1 SH3 domain-containing protein [Paracoccus sp. EF6]